MFRLAVLFVATAAAVAAPVPKSIKKAPPSLDGTWEVVEYHSNGRKVNSALTTRWVIDGQTLQIERINKGGGGAIIRPANTIAYSLVKPDGGADNALDYTITYNNGVTPPRTNPGIIETDGDTLKFAYSLTGGERPKDSTPAQGNMVYIFKRVDTK